MRCAVVKAPSIRKEFFVIFAGDKTVKHKRKENMKKILYHCCLAMTALLATLSCSTATGADDVLPNWNDTPLKAQIIDFVENKTPLIPEEDRIAVFDMDGTIACEQPLWFEMAVAVQKMVDKQEADPSLRELTEYQYAVKLSQNPRDTSVLNHWFTGGHNYLESILVSAFEGVDHEEYIAYANDFLNKATVWNGMKYSELFYQPMLELIEYLKANGYEVFIVSGSMQGLVWSICPQEIGFDREHLIGSRQQLEVGFPENGPASFTIRKGFSTPKNNYYGKSVNIYNRIGRLPVIAVGNTVGDFGMFRLTSSNPLPHFVMMLNHDDAERELAYPPYYKGEEVYQWADSLKTYGWNQADMSKEFKTVWKIRK